MIKKYKKDIIFISIIILVVICIFLVINLCKKTGEYVVVIHNGNEVAKYSLNTNQEIRLNFVENKYNILVIEDGKAYIKEASCPDKFCINQSTISKTGETITCLPNKTVIKVIGGNQEVDVVS